jgi:hypothetical protein
VSLGSEDRLVNLNYRTKVLLHRDLPQLQSLVERKANVIWVRRVVLAIPFAVACLLTVLVNIARPLHWRSEHIAGYCFLFATPWGWLLDRGWFGGVSIRWLNIVLAHMVLLWGPALLYSGCLWLLLRALRFGRRSPRT